MCRREITQLGQEASHVAELQDKLLKKLDLLEHHQVEIYKTLTAVEEEAGKMFDDEEPFRDPLETKRVTLYERAIKLSEQLNQCVPIILPCHRLCDLSAFRNVQQRVCVLQDFWGSGTVHTFSECK